MENTVELLGYYGSDEIIACSAWTSTSRNLTQEKKERIPKLLKMLASEGHHTPFEKGIVHFLVNTDIASHIHLLKHRISSLNAESARYKELKEDKYYLPEDWKNIKTTGKLNPFSDYSIDFSDARIEEDFSARLSWYEILNWYSKLGNYLYHQSLKDLEPVLGRKRAKESARFFKTYNSQIQADVMFNWRSFINFLNLRHSLDKDGEPEAQIEIYHIADEMLKLIKEIPEQPFKFTIEAFGL